LLALKGSDVNTDEKVREIHLRGKERADGEERTKTTKKGASAVPKTRKVPLSRQAMAVLDDLRKTRDNNDERVLPVSSQVVKHAYADACRRSGISGLTFHDLRHTAITRMAAKVPMEKLMKITGHRTSAMLVRYYHPKMIELAQLLD
jgi:integrase